MMLLTNKGQKGIAMSDYTDIVSQGKKRGRKPLPPEEKARRQEIQKAENRKRQEARRRASLVLQHRYSDEFAGLYKKEYEALAKNS
jgi:hypothetical protein